MALRGKRGGLHRWGHLRRAPDNFENIVSPAPQTLRPTGSGVRRTRVRPGDRNGTSVPSSLR